MSQATYVVYAPPSRGQPYLAVTIAVDGSVAATPYETQEEAEAHVKSAAAVGSKGPDQGASAGPLGALLP